MIETLIKLDQEFFLILNGLHATWLDGIMFWVSGKKEWIPFYLAIVSTIIYQFRWRSIIVLVFIGIAILFADQIVSGFMKPFFQRLRPSHEPVLEGMVHIINGYKGGSYGFASSHAANAFGLAMFIYLLFKTKFKYIRLIFLWAAIVAYSRIYLGVHYPGDIITGGIIGTMCGYFSFKVFLKVQNHLDNKSFSKTS